jgi:endonuclease/exonuclease/phosphatase family metal-dependent hydrolase
MAGCASVDPRAVPPVEAGAGARVAVGGGDASVVVMTLNVAHARSDGFHQLLQGAATARRNLDAIADLMQAHEPDIVALQEADGPSFWSGNFDHVDHLARNHSFPYYTRGIHAKGFKLAYGNALLSGLKLADPLSVTFDRKLSFIPKGFVVSSVTWPGSHSLEVDVVSLHLHPLSHEVRKKQAQVLVQTLRERNRPLIVMGDFNTDWQRDGSVLKWVADRLSLEAFEPEHAGLKTFPALDERLDWILVSPRFEFRSYRVLTETVSDHLGVIAEVGLKHAPVMQARR